MLAGTIGGIIMTQKIDENMIGRSCPVCGIDKSDLHSAFDPNVDDYSLVRCSNCHHLYTRLASEPDTQALYEDGDYAIVDTRGSLFERLLCAEYSNVLTRIESICSGVGSLLDFGCGKGRFPALARDRGWSVMGVETSLPRAEFARKVYGLENISTDFYQTGSLRNERFTVIVLFHVLEHLPNPGDLLAELVKHNLANDGLVLVEVPNVGSLQAKLAGINWLHLDMPRHLSHFSRDSLELVLKQAGLQTRRWGRLSFHLGVVGMVQSLFNLLGYRGSLLSDLKYRRSSRLLLGILLLLPAALLLEIVSCWFGRGGVLRVYAKVTDSDRRDDKD